MKEDWNNSELSASTSASEDSEIAFNNSEISNIYSPKYGFENNRSEVETTFCDPVPTDQELYESTFDHLESTEDTITNSPKMNKNSAGKKTIKKTKSKKIIIEQQNEIASLPVEIEALSISQDYSIIGNSQKNVSHTKINKTTIGETEVTQNQEPNINLETNILGKPVISCNINNALIHTCTIETEVSKENGKMEINSSTPESKENIENSLTESETSRQNASKSSDTRNLVKMVQFDIPTTNEDQVAPQPKQKRRMPPKTRTKGTQVNIKEKKQNPPNDAKQVRQKEKKVNNKIPGNEEQNPPNEAKQVKKKEKKVKNNMPENEEQNIPNEVKETKKKDKKVKNDKPNNEKQNPPNEAKQVRRKEKKIKNNIPVNEEENLAIEAKEAKKIKKNVENSIPENEKQNLSTEAKQEEMKVKNNTPGNEENPPNEAKQVNYTENNINTSQEENIINKSASNENLAIPEKNLNIKVFHDIMEPNSSQVTSTENVDVNDQIYYNLSIEEAYDSNQPISITLPAQSRSVATVINVIVKKKEEQQNKEAANLAQYIKEENISPVKANKMSDRPKIKKEKFSDDDYFPKKNNKNSEYTNRKETLADCICGGREELGQESDSSSSSSFSDGSEDCSCSDCDSSWSESCTCSDCCEIQYYSSS